MTEYSELFFSRSDICFFALNRTNRTLTLVTADRAVNPKFEGATIRLATEAADELRDCARHAESFIDCANKAYRAYTKAGKRVWFSKDFDAAPQTDNLFRAIDDTDGLFAKHFPVGLSKEDFLDALDAAADELRELDIETNSPALYHHNASNDYAAYLKRTA